MTSSEARAFLAGYRHTLTDPLPDGSMEVIWCAGRKSPPKAFGRIYDGFQIAWVNLWNPGLQQFNGVEALEIMASCLEEVPVTEKSACPTCQRPFEGRIDDPTLG